LYQIVDNGRNIAFGIFLTTVGLEESGEIAFDDFKEGRGEGPKVHRDETIAIQFDLFAR
jgi:hypothetical protein